MRQLHPEDFENYEVPAHTQVALMRYVNQGLEPGGFLSAVLCNDLIGAVTRADSVNIRALDAIVMFMLNAMPAASIGSTANMDNWMRRVREAAIQPDEE